MGLTASKLISGNRGAVVLSNFPTLIANTDQPRVLFRPGPNGSMITVVRLMDDTEVPDPLSNVRVNKNFTVQFKQNTFYFLEGHNYQIDDPLLTELQDAGAPITLI